MPRTKPTARNTEPTTRAGKVLSNLGNNYTLGQFLYEVFDPDVDAGSQHGAMLKSFLAPSLSKVRAVDIVERMYDHKYAKPADRHDEWAHLFSVSRDPKTLGYAQPAISSWSVQRVKDELLAEADVLCSRKAGLRVRASGGNPRTSRGHSAAVDGPQIDGDTEMVDAEAIDAEGPHDAVEAGDDGENVAVEERAGSPMELDDGLPDEMASAPSGARAAPPRKKKGAVSKDPLISWDIIKDFSVEKVAETYQRHAPTMWGLFSSLTESTSSKGDTELEVVRPKDVICTSIISEVIFARNSWTNLFALSRGITLFATKAHQSMYRIGSRLAQCVSYTTTRAALVAMSTAQREKVRRLFADPDVVPPIVVFDNIQTYARRWFHRIGAASRMLTGTWGTAVKMYDCKPDAFDIRPILEKKEAATRRDIKASNIMDKIDHKHLHTVATFHFLEVLVAFVPALAHYRSDVSKRFKEAAQKVPINPKRRTEVYPLGTNSANEVSTKGLRDALADFLKQLGITQDTIGNRLMFFHGDGKSFDGMHKVLKYLSISASKFSALQFVRPVLEIWHTKWTDLSRICRVHWGGPHSMSDPSTLGFMAKAVNTPTPSDLHKVEYYPYAKLLDIDVRAHILNCWEVRLGTSDLVAYYEKLKDDDHLPSILILLQDADLLAQQYATSRAYYRAIRDRKKPDMYDVPKASEASGSAPTERNDSDFKGDWPLANSILRMRDGIWFLEVVRSVALGDAARAWEILKVWIFTFAGAGNSNYASYLVEMFINLEHDYPAATREALFKNWLVNLKGKPGHFMELDLMQEHFNHWLEELAQHKGKEFDSEWYRNVLSMHVQHFLEITEEFESGAQLKQRRKGHTEPHMDNELREAMRVCRDHDLHRRHDGRDFGHHAEDNLSKGHRRLGAGKKLEEYIEQTMEEWDNKHVEAEVPAGYEDASTYLHVPVSCDESGISIQI
ncbi:hypothetical protein FA95DRAFT_1603903 [Auriscalpium vulgare]|uniref:Uncharacterized protein n=1 Tax=Auriscalpium vulgare TaxID=40419 RepID=A0ACB8S1R8_9AGAM|nr:hypothetical protein FA95DRAFT_1603903 [Auriscalpium vulgare]